MEIVMEEKNRASEMLNQMKRYLHADKSSEPNGETNAPAVSEPPVSQNSPKEPPKARSLPSEESLFEFDDVVFDDVVPERPVLTPEEAEYAEELSEKFGISRDAGVSFLDDTPAQDEVAAPVFEQTASEAPQETEEQPTVEDTTVIDEQPTFDAQEITVEQTVEEVPSVTEEQNTPEVVDEIAEPAHEKASEHEEVTVAQTADGEPAQVMFGGIDNAVRETVKSSTVKTSGVQLTFLDAEPVNEGFADDDAEQMVFGEYEEEYDNIDEDDEPEIDYDEEDDGEAEAQTEHSDAAVAAEEADEIAQSVMAEEAEQVTEEIAESEEESTSFIEPVTDEIHYDEPDEDEQAEAEPAVQDINQLTPIELNAIEEEAERARAAAEAEAVGQEVEVVKAESFDSDIWNDEDKAEYGEKKRFGDFCARLDIPPIKITKEAKTAVSGVKLPTSGYRYEMTERLPLFPDGLNGGKRTESYISREIAYCEEREQKRSEQLLGKLRFASRRLICSFVVMLTVLLIENLNIFFGGNPDGLLGGKYYTVFSLAVAVLLAIGAGLVFDSIRDGLKSAVKGVFIAETLTAGVVIPSIIYHFVIAFAAENSKHSMLFGTGAAVVMFLSGLYRYNMLRRDQIAFSVTSSYGEYLTEVRMSGFKDLPEGRAYDGYADPESSLYKLNRLSRIDASYNDNPVRDECFGIIRKLSLCIICAAVVAGVVFGFLYKDAVYGVLSAISLITYGAPASVFIALSLPRVRAASVSAECGGAIVDFDDESDEFDTSVIMIDEHELFPPELLVSSGFDVQRSPGIEIHLSRTLALFKKIGGSLAAMFSSVEGTIQSFESVVITEIAHDGISARIDGVPISAGSEAYMKRLGIKIKRTDKLLPKNGRVMYIADNGEFFARATLLFRADEELVQKISELRNTETLFSLKTCNPCIDEELIFHTTGLEPELIKLVKYEAGDNVAPAETDREGSLVSKNGALGLLTALLEYKRQKKLVFEATRFACLASAVGAFVSLITSAIKVDFGFSALLMLATHGALSIAAFIMSRRGAINTKSKIKKK